jgi:RES domain-containing protein
MVPQGRGLDQAFSGEGARLFGGRWNSIGTPVVYTSESIALATLELCVHIDKEVNLKEYRVFPVTFSVDLVKIVDSLPEGWNYDPILPAPRKIGDDWASENSSPALKVPSVIVPSEYNYILNPKHPDFQDIQIGEVRPFEIDPRLIQ